MKLGIHIRSANQRFPKAIGRIYVQIGDLKDRLVPIELHGRFNNLMLTFLDENCGVTRVTRRGKDDDIYEVDVGYGYEESYPPEDDVLVIQMIEEKLQQVIENDEGFAAKRAVLLKVIEDWTTEAIGA